MSKKKKSGKTGPTFILLVILIFTAGVRLRLADIPLERDEGEFAYQARLILQGEVPYQSAYNKKLPGVSYMYALGFLAFGDSARSIKYTLLVVNALAILLLYAVAARLYGSRVGLAAAGAYALLSLAASVFGQAGHATQFVNLFLLAGLYLVVCKDPPRWGWIFLAGLMLGAAVLMKQHALLVVPVAFLFLTSPQEKNRRGRLFWMRAAVLGAGAALPYLLLVALVLGRGLFDRFIFWTIKYASEYQAGRSIGDILTTFVQNISFVIGPFWLLWLLGLAGIILTALSKGAFRERFFPAGYFLLGLLSTAPGFFFRNHYFIVVLPAVAVGAGLALESFRAWLKMRSGEGLAGFLTFLAVSVAFLLGIVPQSDYLFKTDPVRLSRNLYGLNPFPESPVIGEFLNKNSGAEDTVAVLGSEAQIYYYSRRRAATGYIYTYGLMDGQPYNRRMQEEMAREVENAG
ncbi:MAG: glycosyltransferase family 39 protein, partial [Candidatus Aminicenantes bacterium]|nr:glycosyltransferase family 39 protein [Candidatus Aminicenantes bacterium]